VLIGDSDESTLAGFSRRHYWSIPATPML